jgi:flagellum-specific ATP synthase
MNARAKSTLLDSWNRYLDDLDRCAATPMPLESQGKLVRVAGLVLEAAGMRLPVGAVCEIHSESRVERTPVLARWWALPVTGPYLMPTAEVHGLSSGARVVPVSTPVNPPPLLGQDNHPWRRSEDRGLHLPMGDGLLGRVVDAQGQPMDRKGPLHRRAPEPMVRRADQRDGPRPGAQPLDTGVRAINAC